MIIGIGGVSRSGKSSLANWLTENLVSSGKQVRVFHQDDFVFAESLIPQIKNRVDWEHPASIDFNAFFSALEKSNKEADVVIGEGLMTFYDKETNALFDKRLFVEIDRETFLDRKAQDDRWGYEPPWYIEHIWTSYLTFGKLPSAGVEALILNGTEKWEEQPIWNYIND